MDGHHAVFAEDCRSSVEHVKFLSPAKAVQSFAPTCACAHFVASASCCLRVFSLKASSLKKNSQHAFPSLSFQLSDYRAVYNFVQAWFFLHRPLLLYENCHTIDIIMLDPADVLTEESVSSSRVDVCFDHAHDCACMAQCLHVCHFSLPLPPLLLIRR